MDKIHYLPTEGTTGFCDIRGYEGLYQINSDGEVISLDRLVSKGEGKSRTVNGVVMKSYCDKKGYQYVNLSKGNKNTRKFIHRLLGDAFIPNPDNKRCINHKNGITTDNRIENLEWCTHAENTKHAFETGLCDPLCRKIVAVDPDSIAYRFDSIASAAQKLSETTGKRFHKASISNSIRQDKKYHGFTFYYAELLPIGYEFKEEEKSDGWMGLTKVLRIVKTETKESIPPPLSMSEILPHAQPEPEESQTPIFDEMLRKYFDYRYHREMSGHQACAELQKEFIIQRKKQ